LNSGRILINLKPLAARKISASDVIRRLQPELAKVPGITLFMQPVQDLSVEDRVSRTEFQYTLEDPNVDELNNVRAADACQTAEAAATERRGQRSTNPGSAGQTGVRSGHRLALGDHHLGDRPDAYMTHTVSAKCRPCSRS
jgi:multidrug efflux pump subunit AcrB